MNSTLTDLAAILLSLAAMIGVYVGISRYQPPAPPAIIYDLNPMKRIAAESTGGLPDPMRRAKPPESKLSAAPVPFDPMRALIKSVAPAPLPGAGRLPPGEAQQMVASICNACHSPQIITQQRLTAAQWQATLAKMTKTNGMAELPPELRGKIVEYLSGHFAP